MDGRIYMHNDPHTMLTRSRELRKNMTREESHLYFDGLKKLPWKFRRQVVMDRYIVDFYCPALRIVIEVDGTQHFLETGKAYDQVRDEVLRGMDLLILRYSNADIRLKFDDVIRDIFAHCEERAKRKSPT